MSEFNCFKCEICGKNHHPMAACCKIPSSLAAPAGSAVAGDFYNGIEWLACWLLDHAEGETITEEQLRPWAAEAWEAHLKLQNKKE